MPEPIATASVTGPISPLAQLLDYGGPVMGVLLALALIGLATFIYAVLTGLLFAPRQNRRLGAAVTRWEAGPDPAQVQAVRQSRSGLDRLNPLPAIVVVAMSGVLDHHGETRQRETIVRLTQRALQPFESPLKLIEVIAALAPLLGLLGTVMGMMEAFSTMASTAGRASASQLSGGIYQALMTTAAGLVIAIPMAAMAAWMEFRLRRLSSGMNDMLTRVLAVDAPAQDSKAPVSGVPPSGEEKADSEQRLAYATG